MPKRKRDEDGGADPVVARPGGIKQQRVTYKLQQGVRKVAHAFKLAKGFERQKLSRRRKTAASQQKAQDVERIDAEIAALKALDHAAAAQQYVYKSLLKIKAVAEQADLPAEVNKPAAKVTDGPTLNVIARLCKSNQAKEALGPVIADVQNALGLEGGRVLKKKRKRAKDYEREDDNVKIEPAVKTEGVSKREASHKTGANGVRDESDSDDFAEFDDRIASSDEDDGGIQDDDDEGSDQSIGELERQLESEGIRRKGAKPSTNGYNHEADLSLSESDSNAASPSPEPQKAPAIKKSSFLPTLTMGGYISGSGSDIEDDIDVAPKKNRRGQRARQQLWEKKYGSKAKHLQREKDSRKAGWDAKRGATGGTERFVKRGPRGKFGGGGRGAHNGVQKPSNDGDIGRKKKHRDDGGAVHPSWEAAKKAKERKEAPIAFQGKKITFD